MRKLYLVIASTVALSFAACDRDANNNASPTGFGGGPPASNEHHGSREHSTFDDGAKPPPAGSAASELPGMPRGTPDFSVKSNDAFGGTAGIANESNGGSGAGATGTKGVGETLHNGLNGDDSDRRPKMDQKPVDLAPGDPTPRED